MTQDEALAEARLGSRIAATVGVRLAETCQAEERATGRAVAEQRQRQLAEELVRKELSTLANAALAQARPMLDAAAEARLTSQVLDALFGHGGLQPYLNDPDIENININGCDNVWLKYADGRRAKGATPVAGSDTQLIELIRMLAARVGTDERRFDRASPTLNLQLRDGSRLFAAHVVCDRPSVSIRRHRFPTATMADLVRLGVIDEGLNAFLTAAVKGRLNILIAGGPGMGKTTTLRALASQIPPEERLITIEDTFELGFDKDPARQGNVTAYQVRDANTEGAGALDQAHLVRCALRGSPDRVIVGEVRGPEVVPMCNAMSQGNDGSMATIHASDSAGAFMKLANYAAQGPERLSLEATNLMVASAVNLVLLLGRSRDGVRTVCSIREITGADGTQIISNEIYRPGPDRRARFNVYPSARTMESLDEGGFDESWFSTPGWPT